MSSDVDVVLGLVYIIFVLFDYKTNIKRQKTATKTQQEQ